MLPKRPGSLLGVGATVDRLPDPVGLLEQVLLRWRAAATTIAFAAATDSGAFAAMRLGRAPGSRRQLRERHDPVHQADLVARGASSGSPVTRSSIATRGGTSHGSGAAHGAPRPTFGPR